jgi:hypothetical protein
MPTYRCIVSRRIADTSYKAEQEYQLDAELVQRYPGYFTPTSQQAAPVAATASEYDDSTEAAVESVEGAESAPASKRRRRF